MTACLTCIFDVAPRAAYGHAPFFLFGFRLLFPFFAFFPLYLEKLTRLRSEITVVRQMLVFMLFQRREGAAERGEEDYADHRFRATPGDLHHV